MGVSTNEASRRMAAAFNMEEPQSTDRACGICGEREGSLYAKRCCDNEDWVEV